MTRVTTEEHNSLTRLALIYMALWLCVTAIFVVLVNRPDPQNLRMHREEHIEIPKINQSPIRA